MWVSAIGGKRLPLLGIRRGIRHHPPLPTQQQRCRPIATVYGAHNKGESKKPGFLRQLSPFHSETAKTDTGGGNPRKQLGQAIQKVESTRPNRQHKQLMQIMGKNRTSYEEIEDFYNRIYHRTKDKLFMDDFVGPVHFCVCTKNNKAAEFAERFVFRWMMKFHQNDRLAEPLGFKVFGMAIQAWVASRNKQSGKRAELLLDKLEQMSRQGGLPFPVPISFYNTSIKAHAIHGDVEKARAVFNRCRQAYELGNEDARPDILSWATLLDAHSKSNNQNAWKEAEELFVLLRKDFKERILRQPPHDFSYNAMINACAKAMQPERAEHWLREMHKDYENGNASAQPNEISFASVLDAWSKSGREDAAQQSYAVLNHMIWLSEETDLPVSPNSWCYNAVIVAFARQGQPREAERVLQRQYDDFKAGNKGAALTVHSFASVIHAWSRAMEDISGERAELVLNRMVELNEHGILMGKPNAFIYNNVIHAWAVLGNYENANQVFERMLEDYKRGNKDAKPGEITFKSLTQASINAKLHNAGQIADELVAQMDSLQLVPKNAEALLIRVRLCWQLSSGTEKNKKRRMTQLQAEIDSIREKSKSR